MKNLIICLILAFASFTLGAQNATLSPEVVATAGETYTSNTLNVDWTLGEIMTETYSGTLILTQGFHQPVLQTTSIGDPASSLGIVKVYPNPTASTISIEREKSGDLQLVLLDMKGSIIKQKTVATSMSELDLSQLPSGIYVLRMTDDKQVSHSLRIVKQ